MSVTYHHPGAAPMGQPLGQPAGPRHRADAEGPPVGWSEDEKAAWWRRQRAWEEHQSHPDEQRRQQLWEAELYAQRLRGLAALRVELFSARHAEHAWRTRNSFGIAPTALCLLYLDPVPQVEMKVAGKLLPDGDQVTDPVRVLYDLCTVASDVVAAGQDPRAEMSENPEPMSDQATFYGAALSLLDTPEGLWRDVRRRADGGGLSIPGRVLAVLADSTMLLADRYEHHRPQHYVVAASNRLDAGWGGLGRIWWYVPELAKQDPTIEMLWYRLHQLRATLGGQRDR